MGQCVQMWTRNYGALDQTARVCFGVLCANRKKEEVKRDFGPANKKERGACCEHTLAFKKGLFLRTQEEKRETGKPGEREERDRKKNPERKKKREKSEEEQKERTRDPERESAKPALNGEKRAESGNWSEKDDERRWR
ncbi:hypothetical protein TNCV_553601 [Trichonephila clavipes]|nr:hypothetical protein TNCV_553601 [Trichonephila clavipes]